MQVTILFCYIFVIIFSIKLTFSSFKILSVSCLFSSLLIPTKNLSNQLKPVKSCPDKYMQLTLRHLRLRQELCRPSWQRSCSSCLCSSPASSLQPGFYPVVWQYNIIITNNITINNIMINNILFCNMTAGFIHI